MLARETRYRGYRDRESIETSCKCFSHLGTLDARRMRILIVQGWATADGTLLSLLKAHALVIELLQLGAQCIKGNFKPRVHVSGPEQTQTVDNFAQTTSNRPRSYLLAAGVLLG